MPSTEAGINSMKPGSSYGPRQQFVSPIMPALNIMTVSKQDMQSSETRQETMSDKVQTMSNGKSRMSMTLQPKIGQRNAFGINQNTQNPYETA